MYIKIITENKDVPVTTIFQTNQVVATTYNAETTNYTVKFVGGNLIILELSNVLSLEWRYGSKSVWAMVDIEKHYDSQEFAVNFDEMIWAENVPDSIGE